MITVHGAATRLVCSACGAAPGPLDPYPFRCPDAGPGTGTGDVDHVLARVLDLDEVRFPGGPPGTGTPFARYRGLLHSYDRAAVAGVCDEEYCEIVTRLDDAVAAVAGTGFVATPFGRSDLLSDRLGFSAAGGVWVKDETHNVTGSHKGRHLMGVLLHLEIAERIGLADPRARPDLAIGSCGNAALAAAALARAAGRRLEVFVPVDADPVVLDGLRDLGADVVTCAREPGTSGDPAFARLRAAVGAGAIPFTCQGSENGLVIEGGETLAWEMVSSLREAGVALDHLVVQVGGGALASACIQGFEEAVSLGALDRRPHTHTVQTAGGHPLERAYERVRARLGASVEPPQIDTVQIDTVQIDTMRIETVLHDAARHRSSYMWPWEQEPHSIATGILDDETYDWRAVVGGMLATGGRPLVVSEQQLARAHELGHAAGYAVCPTGSAGLAGLLDLVETGHVRRDERVGVLFTGVDR